MRRFSSAACVVLGVICAAAVGCSRSSPSSSEDAARPADGGIDARVSTTSSTASSQGSTGSTTSATGHDAAVDATLDAASPATTTLTVSPLALVPAFSPAVHDYYVRCESAANSLTVTMTAAAGSTFALVQPLATVPSAATTVSMTVAANAAIVASLATEGGADEYWVRCLPPDFPELRMTPHADAGIATPGYYLLGDTHTTSEDVGYALMLDGNGVPVWYAATDTGIGPFDVESLLPGNVSFIPANTWPTQAKFELHDLDAGTTTRVTTVGVAVSLHEFRTLPNGHYLLFATPKTAGLDLTGLGMCGADASMEGCIIQEIDSSGALVWQWDITDHFDALQDCTYSTHFCVAAAPYADPFHCNSIDVDADGNLLVSARNMDSVFLIDRSSGAVIWKMGGATYSKDSTTYLSVTNDPMTQFHRQHDARFLADGSISVFDDETDLPGPARAVVYSYDLASGTASWVWQHLGRTPSLIMGSFRTLSDGSRVVGWGSSETAGMAFTEIDALGQDVLDFTFPAGDVSYRAIKVPTSAFDISLLRRTAGTK